MSPGGTAAGSDTTTAQRCGCGSVCWLCYDRNISSVPGDTASQTHGSPSMLQLSDLTVHPAPVARQVIGTSDNSAIAQPVKSNTAATIRPLRSWSSSEKRGPSLDDPRRQRGPRRFSVAGPSAATSAAATSNNSSAKSAAGSRRSRVLASLHTWAEEEDELADGGGGTSLSPVHSGIRTSRLRQQQGYVEYTRTQSSRYTHHQQHSTASISTNGGTSGGMAVRRTMPEAAFSFIDIGSSNSSGIVGGPAPSTLAPTASSVGAAGPRSAMSHHQRLRTPYSISIPSIIGSPLSFTQPFLAAASRTSMYGRQPPSSQIRAAHIDWDSLSMAEEMLGPSPPPWGGGAALQGSGNRNGGGDLPLWQHGAAIDHPPFVSGANGGGGGFAPFSSADKNAIHGVAGGRPGFPQREIGPFNGPGAAELDYQSRMANYYYYQQYLLQSQLHLLPSHLQSAAKQQQMLIQQHQQKIAQQQMQQQQQQSQHLHHSLKQLHNQRPRQAQQQNDLFSELSPGQMANPASAVAAATATAAGMHTNNSNGSNVVGGGFIQPPHVTINEAYEAVVAQLALASEFEKQMSWDYACQRHPMLSSFAVATPLRLSAAWRWGLLCIILASTGCVLVGTPVALMVLLAHQDTTTLLSVAPLSN